MLNNDLKSLNRQLKIDQYEPREIPRVDSGAPEL